MPNPDTWSAIAAAFSAIAAFLSWLAQKRDLHHSVRPHLVLDEWSREQVGDRDCIRAHKIRNLGPGSARQIIVRSLYDEKAKEGPAYLHEHVSLYGLAAGSAAEIDFSIVVRWENAIHQTGCAMVQIPVYVLYWDALQIRHTLQMNLMAVKDLRITAAGSPALAPGLYSYNIKSSSYSVRLLRLRSLLAKIPLFGKPWRKL